MRQSWLAVPESCNPAILKNLSLLKVASERQHAAIDYRTLVVRAISIAGKYFSITLSALLQFQGLSWLTKFPVEFES